MYISWEQGSTSQVSETVYIDVCTDAVHLSSTLKYLGVQLDEQLSFKVQITSKCRTASANLYYLRQIRSYLTQITCQLLVQSLVLSLLDYGNALYHGLPTSTIAPMQRLQNQAAKLVLKRSRYDSSTEALKTLHWLPIRYRSQFKICCLVHRAIMGTAPLYLRELLVQHQPARNTRSASDRGVRLVEPATKRKTFADRSFAVAGPKLWNNLPSDARQIEDHKLFKKRLKTFYFTLAFH